MYREDGFMVRSSPVVWLCLARGTARRNQKRRAEHGHANRDAIAAPPACDRVNGSSRPRHRAPAERAPGSRRRSDARRPEFAAPVPGNPLDRAGHR
jgi:hypothetical protein